MTILINRIMNKSYEGLIDDSLISIDEIYKIKNKVSYILIENKAYDHQTLKITLS